MPDLLLWAAFGFNLGSGLMCWYLMRRYFKRDRANWHRWNRRETEQIMRWSRVERCPTCTARLNEYNGRLAARGMEDDAHG